VPQPLGTQVGELRLAQQSAYVEGLAVETEARLRGVTEQRQKLETLLQELSR